MRKYTTRSAFVLAVLCGQFALMGQNCTPPISQEEVFDFFGYVAGSSIEDAEDDIEIQAFNPSTRGWQTLGHPTDTEDFTVLYRWNFRTTAPSWARADGKKGYMMRLRANYSGSGSATLPTYEKAFCSDGFTEPFGRRLCDGRRVYWENPTGGDDLSSSFFIDRNDWAGPPSSYATSHVYPEYWHGDAYSRFFSLENHPDEPGPADTVYLNFPADPWESENRSRETPWPEGGDSDINFMGQHYPADNAEYVATYPAEYVRSVDLGACSVHVPWEWDRRDTRIEPFLKFPLPEQRGLAESMLDGFETAGDEFEGSYEEHAFWFYNAISNIGKRINHPTQFFRDFAADSADDRICIRSNWWVDGRVIWNPGVENVLGGWIVSLIGSIFQFGECRRDREMTIQFCGQFDVAPTGQPGFTLDEDSIEVKIQGYSTLFRPICNTLVIPAIEKGVTETIKAGTGQQIADQVNDAFGGPLPAGLQIRRVEMLPSGLEYILAEDEDDPQFDLMLLASDPANDYLRPLLGIPAEFPHTAELCRLDYNTSPTGEPLWEQTARAGRNEHMTVGDIWLPPSNVEKAGEIAFDSEALITEAQADEEAACSCKLY